jgi:hypothetical protein
MNDIAYLAIILAFFVLAGLFVVACDRIIGPDEDALAVRSAAEPEPEPEKAAA